MSSMSDMGWKTFLDRMRAEDFEGLTPDFLDELEADLTATDTAHADFVSGAESRLTESTTRIGERDAEISRLKGVNFDLLMEKRESSGAGSGGDGTGSGESKDDKPAITGIDSLFG